MNWAVKYRPTEYEQIALSPELRKLFEKRILKDKHLGDFLFYSKDPGIGKTTLAKMLGEIFNYEVIFINASKEGNMDTIRNTIDRAVNYASIEKNGKLIILDEAERISPAAQESLRGILEEERYENLNFIFTVNNKNRLIKPIAESRLLPLDFTLPKEFEINNPEFKSSVLAPILKYLIYILKDNNIQFETNDLYNMVKDDYPNLRLIVNKMEFSIVNGILTPSSYLTSSNKIEEEELLELIKSKNFEELYKRSKDFYTINYFIKYLKNKMTEIFEGEDIKKVIQYMNEYQNNLISDEDVKSLDFLYKLTELNFKD